MTPQSDLGDLRAVLVKRVADYAAFIATSLMREISIG